MQATGNKIELGMLADSREERKGSSKPGMQQPMCDRKKDGPRISTTIKAGSLINAKRQNKRKGTDSR
jgi:hypothetical protein